MRKPSSSDNIIAWPNNKSLLCQKLNYILEDEEIIKKSDKI